ncbi:MAG: hypothetical protein VW907_10945, partial [Opitutae bacterium]
DAHYVENDVLTPFLRAHHIIKEDPDALIVFCDFASDKIYRILETVPEFERFVYIDLGSRLIRSVNQKEWTIICWAIGRRQNTDHRQNIKANQRAGLTEHIP